ncbi:low affinity iron permease family protein [Chryseobacterium lactis]|uniref:low affinity iron permease family protein n=1 Tax=Chryseobacterium lactis TaxID=1241981 RepID=UPI00162859AA|nr:low affinity iron permease family protein [Chryseobacterium lactis]
MIKNIFDKLAHWPGYTLLGITGLAVIFLKNTQSRDLKELQTKLDELIAASKKTMLEHQFQDLTEEELNQLQNFHKNVEIRRAESLAENDEKPEKEITYYRYK